MAAKHEIYNSSWYDTNLGKPSWPSQYKNSQTYFIVAVDIYISHILFKMRAFVCLNEFLSSNWSVKLLCNVVWHIYELQKICSLEQKCCCRVFVSRWSWVTDKILLFLRSTQKIWQCDLLCLSDNGSQQLWTLRIVGFNFHTIRIIHMNK